MRESLLIIILYSVSSCSPPRIALLTAGCKGLVHHCQNKVVIVVVVNDCEFKALIVLSLGMFFQILYYFVLIFLYRENGLEPDLDSYGALLIVYGEAGNLEAILKVFSI